MAILIHKQNYSLVDITGELCQPKGQRDLSGETPYKLLVVILRLWIGPHFESLYSSGLINLVVVATGEQCLLNGKEVPVVYYWGIFDLSSFSEILEKFQAIKRIVSISP